MEYVYKHMDWSNVEVLGRNRLPVRPFYCGYPIKDRQDRKKRRMFQLPSVERTVEICLL